MAWVLPAESDVLHQDKDNASVKEVSHGGFDPETPPVPQPGR
jgi:hypothetical protein